MDVIDLGVVTDPDEPARQPFTRRLRQFRNLRRWLIAAVAVLCLLGLAASALPRETGPHLRWSIPMTGADDVFTVSGDQVYVLSGSMVEGRRLSAYELQTGKQLWSATDLGNAAWIGTVAFGVITLPVGNTTSVVDGAAVSNSFISDTVAVDAATGKQLWRLPGEYATSNGRQALLTQRDETGASVQSLRAVGLRDGKTAWEHTKTGVQSWFSAPDGDRLTTANGDGLIEVLNFADGTPVTSKQVPQPGSTGSVQRYILLSGEHQQLYARSIVDSKATIAAYDPGTLAEHWHLTSDTFDNFYGCGPMMCLNDANGLSAYDPATGRRLWQHAGNGGLVTPLGTDRLVLSEGDNAERHSILDGSTGATLVDLGTSALAYDPLDSTTSAYVLTPEKDALGKTAVADLDQRTGAMVQRGTIDRVKDFSCRTAGELLLCTSILGRLTVTELGDLP